MAETVRIEIPIETIDETEPELSNLVKKLTKVGKAADEMGNSSQRAREKVSKFDRSAEKTQKSLSKWAKEKYEVLLEAKERITPVLRTLGSGMKNFTGRTWHVTMKAVDLVTAPVRGILNVLKNPVFQVGAVLGVSIGLKDTIDTYKGFEAAMSKVSAVSGATGSDLEKLNEKAKEMGATTKFTATEAAEGFNYMSMAGWKTQDMLDGIEGIMSLAAASGEDLATTSDIVTDALTAFNLQASDSGHFADVLAAASSNANTNVSMMGESFKYVAPVAGAMKYSVEDVSLALGLMANASVKSSMAGTSLKTAIANLAAPTDKMQAAMKKYNISLTDSKGKAKDFKAVIDNARSSLGKLSETEQTAAIKTIFGKEAMAGMAAIVNASEKDYNKLAKAVNNADGASATMAATMLDNLEGSITLFQSALDGAKLSLGERLAPYVRSAADWLTDMMPSVESALDDLMDYVDRKADKLKRKFKDMTDTQDWENADFFGKVKISWDEFILTPFKEWWNGTGKAGIANTLGDFGELLGSGLNAGILTLLGFNVSGTMDEGASIGASFAKGFAEGFDFDEISSKLWEGFKNILGNASKLLPGGEVADLSSLMSAALLAKIAGPLFSVGSGGIKLGKALFGSGGSEGGGSLLGSLIGSAGAGSGILGFGANTAINLGAGNLAGGASLSAGALSAIGLGSIAGGVAGAAGLVHGGMDLYEGFTSDDEERAAVYKKAGAVEVGGTLAGAGAGAATGAAIGALFGGVGAVPGALIGMGIGAIGSWMAGNKIKGDYEADEKARQEALANQQKAYHVLGMDIDDVKFKTKALNEAIHDSETSTEEFAKMYQEAVADNLKSHFGDVSLSLKEIKKIADDTVFSKQAKQLDIYSEAAEKTSTALDSLESSITELNKQNWKMNLGMKLDDTDMTAYQSAIDSYVENAKTYLENSHYQATLSVELLLGKKNSKDVTDAFDTTYSSMEKSLDRLSKDLSKKVESALADGVIDAKEQKAITALQDKISSVTDKVTNAEEKASLNALKVKYSTGDIDASSFDSLQQELAANTQIASQKYYDAMQTALASLELSKGSMSKKKYKSEYTRIKETYQDKIDALTNRSTDFQFDVLEDNYGKQLNGILPDIEGTTKDKLKKALDNAFVYEPDSTLWSQNDIVKWFDLDKVDAESRGAIISIIQQIAKSVPEDQKKTIEDRFKETIPSAEEILKNLDFTQISIDDWYKMRGLDTPTTGITNPGETYDINAPLLTGNESNYQELAAKYSEQIHGALEKNPELVQNFLKEYMSSALSNVDQDTADAVNEAGKTVGDNTVTAASESIANGSATLRGALENCLNTATTSPFTPNVTISPNYSVTQFDKNSLFGNSSNFTGGKSSSATLAPSVTPVPTKHAGGGYASGRQLSWLAEEGYGEWVIPTAPGRRARALELYKQAGRSLGVQENANGGFVSQYGSSYGTDTGVSEDFLYSDGETAVYSGESGSGGDTNIEVNVTVNPEFTINGSEVQSPEEVLEVVRRHMGEIADEVGGEIASQLKISFSNRPLKEA